MKYDKKQATIARETIAAAMTHGTCEVVRFGRRFGVLVNIPAKHRSFDYDYVATVISDESLSLVLASIETEVGA